MAEVVVDANVLLRYLTDAPRELADQAAAILEAAEQRRTQLAVASLTLAEVVYVLESVYRWSRGDIATRLLDLVSSGVVECLEEDTVTQALTWYRASGRIHSADAYIAALATERGHGTVISFDRDLRRVAGVTVVQEAEELPRR